MDDFDVTAALDRMELRDAPEQRDLSVSFSLSRLGEVEMKAGNLAAAREFLLRCHNIF